MPELPVEFILFACTLAGVAIFHHKALAVAASGLTAITHYRLAVVGFKEGRGLDGLARHLVHEWVVLANLAGLLMGFALLSRHFEESQVLKVLPRFLPEGWRGPFMLLVMVFVLSSFLDNIAAALIGAAMARSLFPTVHIGFLAGIVAASNAGGSGSVVGDTTTTMMWIAGKSPVDVFHAYVAAVVALVLSGLFAAFQQQRRAPMDRAALSNITVDWPRLGIVAAILVAAVSANVVVNTQFPGVASAFPFLGATVWIVLLLTALIRRPDWSVLPETAKGTMFLLSLVLAASLMPVEHLPSPTWQTTMGLGFVSAVFDNIPLTALALSQGGYDWACSPTPSATAGR